MLSYLFPWYDDAIQAAIIIAGENWYRTMIIRMTVCYLADASFQPVAWELSHQSPAPARLTGPTGGPAN